jgi:hypothetical protein
MSNKRRTRQSSQDDEPKTIGELRARLKAMGNPWQVHLSLADADPLPQPARGGAPEDEPRKETFESGKAMRAALRAAPPSNPFLLRAWVASGLLSAREIKGRPPGTSEPAAAAGSTKTKPHAARTKKARRKS